jgi:hypothetical protein
VIFLPTRLATWQPEFDVLNSKIVQFVVDNDRERFAAFEEVGFFSQNLKSISYSTTKGPILTKCSSVPLSRLRQGSIFRNSISAENFFG